MATEDLSNLTAFMAVARERSFTRAAKQLGLSPSALSHTISKIESRLGSSAQSHHAQRLADGSGRAPAANRWSAYRGDRGGDGRAAVLG